MGIFKKVIHGIGGALLGGLTGGISKRIEAQVGGEKAARYGATGYEGSAQQARQHYDTSQAVSQGQQRDNSATLQYNEITSRERMQRVQHAHEMKMLSNDGQSSEGQDPLKPFKEWANLPEGHPSNHPAMSPKNFRPNTVPEGTGRRDWNTRRRGY